MKKLSVAVALIAGALALPAHAQVVVTNDIAYGPYAQHRLDLCTPAGGVATSGVILIHGGGWSTGDKTIMAARCTKYAEAGIITATINYRLVVPNALPTGAWPRHGHRRAACHASAGADETGLK